MREPYWEEYLITSRKPIKVRRITSRIVQPGH